MTVVVKLGSSLIVERGNVRRPLVRSRARKVAETVKGGEPVCIVSSGAIALGLPRLGLDRRPRSVPRLQAASALGQVRLHAAWERALAPLPGGADPPHGGDVADRIAYLNARNALQACSGSVPS